MSDPLSLPDRLKTFVEASSWTFAKTYAQTWPHEYIVRDRVDESLFVDLVHHIRTHGYEGKFYRKSITYFDEDGLVYWTMGEPVEETTIINRCKQERTYDHRLRSGTLPEQINKAEQTRFSEPGDGALVDNRGSVAPGR
jgi:hypothetical protein